jgi:hypothetical protein
MEFADLFAEKGMSLGYVTHDLLDACAFALVLMVTTAVDTETPTGTPSASDPIGVSSY